MGKHLDINLTGEPTECEVKANGANFPLVMAIDIEARQGEAMTVTLRCDRDGDIRIKSKFLPSAGLPPEIIDMELVIQEGHCSYCSFAGTANAFSADEVKVWADYNGRDQMVRVVLKGNILGDPVRRVIEGVLVPDPENA